MVFSSREIPLFILLVLASPAAFAGDSGIAVANLDPAAKQESGNRVTPPAVSERYEYYEIKGTNEKELRSQMCRNGCALDNGETYDSVTAWRWKLQYGYDRRPGSCALDSFRVDLFITYRFPKWVQNGGVDRALVEKWENYQKRLAIHENGHRDLAVEAASGLSQIAAGLPPASSCAELDRQVRTLGRDRMEKLNADEKSYDDVTAHGRTQGAVFP